MTSVAAVDANAILRLLVGDPPEMAEQARRLFDAVDRRDIQLVLEEIVLAEVVWVLESFYGHPRAQIAEVLRSLLSHEGILVDDRALLLQALSTYAHEGIDFADAVLTAKMQRRGLRELFSFDRDFDRIPSIEHRAPGD